PGGVVGCTLEDLRGLPEHLLLRAALLMGGAGSRDAALDLGDRLGGRRRHGLTGGESEEAGRRLEAAGGLEDAARGGVAGVRGAGVGVVAHEGRPGTYSCLASVVLGAEATVAARRPVRLRRCLALVGELVTRPVGALIRQGGAVPRSATAHTRAAGVVDGAEKAVIAGQTVRLVRVGAGTGGRIADSCLVTLIERGAEDGVRTATGAGLTGVGLGAGITVVAGGAVGLGRIGASAGGGIAGAGVVALVGGGADHRALPAANARLAGVDLGAGVAVVARRALSLGRVGAGARGGVADAGVVALIGGRADDGIRARADGVVADVGLGAGIHVGA